MTRNLNNTQKEFLNKEFSVDGFSSRWSLTRSEFESWPIPMMAFLFTDEQMQNLADEVSNTLKSVGFNENDPDKDGLFDFWFETIETTAVNMGMEYYDDFSDEEIEEMSKEFNSMA